MLHPKLSYLRGLGAYSAHLPGQIIERKLLLRHGTDLEVRRSKGSPKAVFRKMRWVLQWPEEGAEAARGTLSIWSDGTGLRLDAPRALDLRWALSFAI